MTWTAKDAAGNTGTATQKVEVTDKTPPVLNLPADFKAEATGPSGAAVDFTAAASDLVDVTVTVNSVPASGSTFVLGETTVNCVATDSHGNKAIGSFKITVVDTTAPVVTAPEDVAFEATGPQSTVTIGTANAVDAVGVVTLDSDAPATYPVGITTVTWTAKDAAGNTGTATQKVEVKDTIAPKLTMPADINVYATSGLGTTVTFAKPTAYDLVDGDVVVIINRTSGSIFPVGQTTVTCTAIDSNNNAVTGSFKVNVTYSFKGFFQPIDMAPILNTVKAGSAVPVKFSLNGNMGLSIFESGYPRAVAITPSTGSISDDIETVVTAGNSSLSYDSATGQYIYVWKTDKSWTGLAKQLQVKFIDGKIYTANFKFK